MSPKRRDDFVWIRPVEGCGGVNVNCGSVHVSCTREHPQEVTRGEWDVILKRWGQLEICQRPEGV